MTCKNELETLTTEAISVADWEEVKANVRSILRRITRLLGPVWPAAFVKCSQTWIRRQRRGRWIVCSLRGLGESSNTPDKEKFLANSRI
jgi:hypothetical protein